MDAEELWSKMERAVMLLHQSKEEAVYFAMDRFGYSKTMDKATYQRNKENILKNTSLLCPANTDRSVSLPISV